MAATRRTWPDARCEVCGISDADNRNRSDYRDMIEMRMWTGKDGVWRVRCRRHLPKAILRTLKPVWP